MQENAQPQPDSGWRTIAVRPRLAARILLIRARMMEQEHIDVPSWMAVERGVEMLERQYGISLPDQYPGIPDVSQDISDGLHAQNTGDPQ